jgi:4-amino-4-deoxy-L-arabinose transferase-like glycosyltransferase
VEAATAPPPAVPVPAWLRSPLVPLAGIVFGAALLRLWALNAANPNPYYDASVLSMGGSLHNFVYGAIEPGGTAAIDKPPVGLWLSVLSVKLLGFSPRAVILPQALASAAAVPLLYSIVRRGFGRGAGLAAAAALAVLPIAVVTARSDTMDALATTLVLAAALLTVRAAQSGRTLFLVAAGAVCGLGFEVKLFEALLAVPALVVLYWIAAPRSKARRALDIQGFTVALVAVALAWPAVVSLAPLSKRPYPIGSTDGTVWSSIFDFNGAQRIAGPRHSHTGRHAIKHPQLLVAADQPGAGRLFATGGKNLAKLIGAELAAAVILGGLALITRLRGRAPPPGPQRLGLALGAAFVCWLVPAAFLFSQVQTLHPRYLEAMGPPVAAILGVGIAALAGLAGRNVVLRVAAAAALLGVCAFAASVEPGVAVVVWAAGVAAAVALFVPMRHAAPAAALLAAVAVLAVPAAASVDQVAANVSVSGGSTVKRHVIAAVSAYLGPRTRGARIEVVAATYPQAASIVAHDGRPVLLLTQVNGRPLTTVRTLRTAVRSGELRYAFVRGSCARARNLQRKKCIATVRWIRTHGTPVAHGAAWAPLGRLFRLHSGLTHAGLTRSQHAHRLH